MRCNRDGYSWGLSSALHRWVRILRPVFECVYSLNCLTSIVRTHKLVLLLLTVILPLSVGLWLREHTKRRKLAPLLAERERIADFAEVGTPTIGGGFVAATYLYGRTREIALEPTDAPDRVRVVRVAEDLPIQPMVSPNKKWIAYRDHLNRTNRLHIIHADDGAVQTNIELGPEERIEGARWSPDGQYIAYAQRNGDASQLVVFDVVKGQGHRAASQAYAPLAWSPDAQRIAFHRGGSIVSAAASGASAEATVGTMDNARGCLEWSPDGKHLAYCRAETPDCDRLFLYDVASGSDHSVSEAAVCVGHVAWFPQSDAIAFAGRGQPISVARLNSVETAPVVDSQGVVKAMGVTETGSILWASTSPNRPYSFWQVDKPGGVPARVFGALQRDPRFQQPMQRLEGLGPAVFRFSRTCGRPTDRGLALVWFPCGGIDGTPRWLQEIAYLNLHGVTVFMVDLVSEPHDPKDVLSQHIELGVATVERIKREPDVDTDSLFLFSCCGASSLGYSVMVREASSFRGAIDLHGTPGDAMGGPLESAERIPPILWMTLQQDRAARSRDRLRGKLQHRGFELVDKVYDTNHWYQDAAARKQILRDLAEFVRARSAYACEREMP